MATKRKPTFCFTCSACPLPFMGVALRHKVYWYGVSAVQRFTFCTSIANCWRAGFTCFTSLPSATTSPSASIRQYVTILLPWFQNVISNFPFLKVCSSIEGVTCNESMRVAYTRPVDNTSNIKNNNFFIRKEFISYSSSCSKPRSFFSLQHNRAHYQLLPLQHRQTKVRNE